MHKIRLSATEYKILQQFSLSDKWLADLLVRHPAQNRGHSIVELSREECEQLRDHLTTRLAQIGFDRNYVPNEQGILLEAIVDRLYLQ